MRSPGLLHRLPRLRAVVQRRAQAVRQSFARELQNVEARLAGRRLQVRAGLTVELHDMKMLVESTLGGA